MTDQLALELTAAAAKGPKAKSSGVVQNRHVSASNSGSGRRNKHSPGAFSCIIHQFLLCFPLLVTLLPFGLALCLLSNSTDRKDQVHKWTSVQVTGVRPQPRYAHTATLLKFSRFLVFGGTDGTHLFNDGKSLYTHAATNSTQCLI